MKNIIKLLNKCVFYGINKLNFITSIICLFIILMMSPISHGTDNSIYTTLSNQIALNDELSITANNMSHANTAGFKRDMQIMSSYTSKDKIDNLQMPDDIASIPDFTLGSLKQTNNPFNAAINGEGFFMIETQSGMSYSRNGNFSINNEGILIDQQGNYVLSDGGDQIAIPLQNSNVFINKNGNIYSSNELIGVIGVYNFSDLKFLRKSGNGYFNTTLEPIPSENFQLLQGFLEESNSKPIIETTKLIDLQKKFSMSSNLISDVYAMQRNSFRLISK